MQMNKLLPLILILFAAPCFGESYLCVADKAVGFDGSENFAGTNFKTDPTYSPSKYLVRPPKDDDPFFINDDGTKRPRLLHKRYITKYTKYVVLELGGYVGDDIIDAYCEESLASKQMNMGIPDEYRCSNGRIHFGFSKKTLRFYSLSPSTYLRGLHDSMNQVVLEIGKCSKNINAHHPIL